jgi:hypothetical protein
MSGKLSSLPIGFCQAKHGGKLESLPDTDLQFELNNLYANGFSSALGP